MNLYKKLKYVSIVLLSILFAMILHALTSDYSTTPETADWSFFVEKFGLIKIIAVWYLIAFGSIAFIFYRYENKIPGSGSEKGIRYGSAVSILWLWGMLEGVSLYNNSFINEFITGLCDAVPIFFMGLLLGKFTSKRNYSISTKKLINHSIEIIHLFIFSIIFLAGRYYLYLSNIIDSGYKSEPYFTLAWTMVMGICIGITYVLLGNTVQNSSIILNSVEFGTVIFGVNWLVFIIFIPFIFEVSLTDSVIRAISDSMLVTASCFISEIIKNPMYEKFNNKLKL